MSLLLAPQLELRKRTILLKKAIKLLSRYFLNAKCINNAYNSVNKDYFMLQSSLSF